MMTDKQEPSLEERRQMIEEKRNALRRAGFDSTLEAISLGAQKVEGAANERERLQVIKDLRSKAANAYASAKELDELLRSLPEKEAEA